jgi:hypothetical protein
LTSEGDTNSVAFLFTGVAAIAQLSAICAGTGAFFRVY